MIQEEKQLLLKDLCAKQPWGVKVQYNNKVYAIDYVSVEYEEVKLDILDNYTVGLSDIKPYLRPMSSITEKEKLEVKEYLNSIEGKLIGFKARTIWVIDYLNSIHVDYRSLIPKGLAVEVTKENNPYEEINL